MTLSFGRFGGKVAAAVRWISALAAVLVAGMVTTGARSEEAPLVAAASSVQQAVTAIAARFASDTGRSVRLTFGSSGNFVTQIRQGAPFELFLAADEDSVSDLAAAGLTVDSGVIYAIGRLVIIIPEGSPLRADGDLGDLVSAVADRRLTRFAIANPTHAPYGQRAKEALLHVGIWQAIGDRLVIGENVAQAAQFAQSGSAQGGIIAHSLVVAPELADGPTYAAIPQGYHAPLRHSMTLLRGHGATARMFFEYIQGPAGRAILEQHGFAVPMPNG